MQKGKLGICLPFYAIVGLILALLGQTLLCGLLMGFVIVAEKDEWTSRQTMQAFFLSLFVSVVSYILDVLNITREIPLVNVALNTVFGVIEGVVGLLVLIFVIIGLTRVVKGRDAGIPVLSKLAKRAFGIVEQKVYTQMPGSYQAPSQPPVPPQNSQSNPPQQ